MISCPSPQKPPKTCAPRPCVQQHTQTHQPHDFLFRHLSAAVLNLQGQGSVLTLWHRDNVVTTAVCTVCYKRLQQLVCYSQRHLLAEVLYLLRAANQYTFGLTMLHARLPRVGPGAADTARFIAEKTSAGVIS